MKTATPWIICLIFFIVILLQQMCKGKPNAGMVPKSDYEAQKQVTKDTVKYFNEIIKADDAAIDMATAHAVQSAEQAMESDAKATEWQNVVARQNAKIDAAEKEKPDGSFIPVSPNYIDGCDSLRIATKFQDTQLNRLKRDNAELVASKQNEISIRDTALANRMRFNYALQKQLDTCQGKLKEREEPVKIKNQWFGEVGLMGNQVNPIGGGEAGITLINKKGVMYGVKAQALNGRVWYGVKTGFRLFR